MRSGGLIYLRSTTGVYRVEPSFDTNGEVYIYQCDFDDCGIEWVWFITFVRNPDGATISLACRDIGQFEVCDTFSYVT